MKKRSLARSVFIAFAGGLLLWAGALVLWQTRAFVLLLFVGITFGVTIGRAAEALERWRIPRALTSPLVVFGAAALLITGAWRMAPEVTAQLRQIELHVPAAIDRAEDMLRNRTFAGVDLPEPDLTPRRVARQFLAGQSRDLASLLFPFVSNVVTTIIGFVVVLFVAIYVAVEPDVYRRATIRLVPIDRRKDAEAILERAAAILRQWLGARLLAMLIIGIVTSVTLWALDVPAYIALGALAGLLEFIPFFGPIVSGIPAVAMALTISPAKAMYVALAYVAIQQLEGNLLTPLLMRSRIAVPPVVTIAAVSMMGIIFGVMGMLLSEPVAALAILFTRELYVRRLEERRAITPAGTG